MTPSTEREATRFPVLYGRPQSCVELVAIHRRRLLYVVIKLRLDCERGAGLARRVVEGLHIRVLERNARRQPLLWVDVACLDSYDIDTDLTCLPYFLLASKHYIFLVGASFPRRLW